MEQGLLEERGAPPTSFADTIESHFHNLTVRNRVDSNALLWFTNVVEVRERAGPGRHGAFNLADRVQDSAGDERGNPRHAGASALSLYARERR